MFDADNLQVNAGFKDRDWQVLPVVYEDQHSLSYILKGVDVVISTVSGEPQLALVDAAAAAQVRHFIPSGFSGPQQCAPRTTITPSNEWQTLIARLDHHQLESSMRYTVFTCGIFFEQFSPGGLNAMQICTVTSQNAGIGEEGTFLVDLRAGKAMIPVIPDGQEEVVVCMTSVRDVARYIVAAMQAYNDMTVWPTEFRFYTERMTMSELLNTCSRARGKLFLSLSTNPISVAWMDVSPFRGWNHWYRLRFPTMLHPHSCLRLSVVLHPSLGQISVLSVLRTLINTAILPEETNRQVTPVGKPPTWGKSCLCTRRIRKDIMAQ